ncbi:MAG: ankyrin repeat domain-containing protein [Nannocystaceae bacterium]|nr:ankyrin repeat domain-containing protein [Nannocystaceae bacterium]
MEIYGLRPDDPAVFHAIANEDLEAVQEILRENANSANARMADPDQTPLIAAAWKANLAILTALLGAGADPNATNQNGQTALIVAAKSGADPLLLRLIEQGAGVNGRSHGDTVLHTAVQTCERDVVQALLGAGADVNAERNDGATPLLMAAHAKRTDNAAVLIASGAEVTGARQALNANGPYDYALMIAADHGASDLVELFLTHSWRQDIMDCSLKMAAETGDLTSVKLLREAGADPRAKTGVRPKSAVEVARRKKHKAIVEYLLRLESACV